MLEERRTNREEGIPPRTAGTLFGDLGDRLARAFGGTGRGPAQWDEGDQDTVAWEQTAPRFPVARLGYDCALVDQHLVDVERELAELRTGASSRQSVAAEIEKIGEQTATILKAAHEQAQQITRAAQRQADACVADAAANAVSITEEANQKLRQLDTETDAIWNERTRLIEDARNVATSLFRLAEEAAERFPTDGDRAQLAESAPAEEASSPVSAFG
jgi:DivIVA protein